MTTETPTDETTPQTDSPYWRVRKEASPVWLCEVTREPVTYVECLACVFVKRKVIQLINEK